MFWASIGGVMLVMYGSPVTVKESGADAVLAAVVTTTWTTPLARPGTVTWTDVSVQDVTGADADPNVTVPAAAPKPVPLMVTGEPDGPVAGFKVVTDTAVPLSLDPASDPDPKLEPEPELDFEPELDPVPELDPLPEHPLQAP